MKILNTSLTVFESTKFGNIRVVEKDNLPWFVASDICKALGLKNISETLKRLDRDDLSSTEVIDSVGRKQQSYIVNEPGLYILVFLSRKKEAQNFRKWVTTEVLPSIRKHGYYLPNPIKKVFHDHIQALEKKAKKELRHKDELMDMIFDALKKIPLQLPESAE